MVRRAGLWIFTLSFAAALPSLVGSGGTPRANAVVPPEPDGGASSSLAAPGRICSPPIRRRAHARRASSAPAGRSPSRRSQAW